MRRAVVTACLLASACTRAPLRPTAFDPSKGTAVLALGPSADADRVDTSKRLRLIGVRDASGRIVLGPAGEDRCSPAPIHLNPGRYTLEVERCTSTCTGARFSIPVDAQRGHGYRVIIDKAMLSLHLIVTEWEAFLVDDTSDASRSVGKAVEHCD